MKCSSYLLKLKLIIHECFSRPSLCVLAYKFLELMVNQMVQRLFDSPRLLCFPVGGLLEQGSAVNKFISSRICIDTIIFLVLKIKHFGLKVSIFVSILCLQKKTIFWMALDHAPKCSFSSWKWVKGQMFTLGLFILASVSPSDCSFPHSPWMMNKLEENFTDLETIKTLCTSAF